ncbi:MAG: response regulator [candidate division NC10 bacterium]|nr:response regulator [candidate division NC10 bacterium]
MAIPSEGPATTILVIDDQAFFTTMLRNVLEQHGYKVVAASNGPDGIAAARQFKPDAILLDVEMPAMDGFTVCQALKADAALRHIPVMILTSTDDAKLNKKAFAAGADITALKAVSGERLVNTLRLALMQRPPSAS